MPGLKLNTASGGSVSIEPTNTASNYTLTVPAQTGTVIASDSSGNVGIGTSSPQNQLHINGTTTGYARFQSSNRTFTIGSLASAYGFVINDVDSGQQVMQIDAGGLFKFNSGYGSVATAYGCRAWVNFDGTGTVAIRGSGNVSSITDNAVGNYTVNFTNAMTDTNYGYCGGAIREIAGDGAFSVCPGLGDIKSTTQLQVRTVFSNTRYDIPQVSVFIFR